MRNIHFLLLLLVFGIAAVGVLSESAASDPRDEARKFLGLVRKGDVEAALGQFGDNTCHCAPKGGYTSYFQYESGVDPNIAFLLGQPFVVNKKMPMVQMADRQPYLWPWDKPETFALDTQVQFDNRQQAPYFLPMDTAFGQEISAEQLNKFIANPADGAARAFSLRLRPSLKPGFVPTPKPSKEETERDKAAREALPPEMAKYLYPKDAGLIKVDAGKTAPVEQFANKLPRLSSAIVRLYVVRRGQLNRWTIKKLQLHDPTLVTEQGEVIQVINSKAPAPSDLEKPGNSS